MYVPEGFSKSTHVTAIFVTQPDGTMMYVYDSDILGTVGDYAQMSDAEIIAFVNNNVTDSRNKLGFATDDLKQEIKEYVQENRFSYDFNLITDETGNNVISQEFVYQAYPEIISYIDYE